MNLVVYPFFNLTYLNYNHSGPVNIFEQRIYLLSRACEIFRAPLTLLKLQLVFKGFTELCIDQTEK